MGNLRSVVVTGGGTAGHVIPSKPIIESLCSKGTKVIFIGSTSGLEERLIEDLDIEFRGITTGKLRRYFSLQNVLDMFRVPVGILQASFLMLRLKPQVVFSKGGYVAFPVVVAAWLNRIPVISHESDLTAGLANRMALPFTDTLCVNFSASKINAKRILVTGTPVRKALLEGNAQRAKEWLKLESSKPVLVVVGGSLGAENVNAIVRDALGALCAIYHVVHICGPGKLSDEHDGTDNYQQFEYVDEYWGDVLALADVVVSRAGANSLYELLSLRKPNLLVPLPLTASRGDQIENAEMAEKSGWSLVIQEDELNPTNLVEHVDTLIKEHDQWCERLESFERLDSVELIEQLLQSSVAKKAR